MNIKIEKLQPNNIPLTCPISKSVLLRHIIASFLSEEQTTLPYYPSQDVLSALRLIESLGAELTYANNNVTVLPPRKIKECVCSVGESATLLRIFLPLLATVGGEYALQKEGSLRLRSIQPMREFLSNHGVKTENGDTVTISGKLEGERFTFPAYYSSQYISGLLFALPLLKNNSTLLLEGETVSSDYINLTIQVLRQYGIVIEKMENGYFIYGDQTYHAPQSPKIEGDWSQGAYFACLGVPVHGLTLDSLQPDRALLQAFTEANISYRFENDTLYAQTSNIRSFSFDIANCPDLAPALCTLATGFEGTLQLFGTHRLRDKESDREKEIISFFRALGIQSKQESDSFTLFCRKIVSPLTYDVPCDHRIGMMAVASLFMANGGTLNNFDTSKSYPNFLEDCARIGGIWKGL